MRRATWRIGLLGLLVASGCGGGSHETGLGRVHRTGVLRWGADVQGGEPFASADPANPGRMRGFEVEIAEALARALGVRAEMVQCDWSTLVPALERGTFDVALNGLEATPTLAARILLTRPYFVFTERLVARRGDGRIRDLASLHGLRVGTLANSEAWHMLRLSGAVTVPYEGVEEPFIDLERGRTDAVLMDDIIVDRYGAPRVSLRVVGDVADGVYAAGVRRDDKNLRDALDRALTQLIESGDLRRILARWNIDGPRQDGLARHEAPAALTAVVSPSLSPAEMALFARGAATTLLLSLAAMALAIPLGVGLALARSRGGRVLGGLAGAYIEIFRGTPVLLQLYVLYYGLAGVVALDAWTAAILGLGLNYAAYEAEVYRAGIQAVPGGQMEAASALGMSTALAIRRVLLPQAFRFALPGMTNDFIALLKDTSLVSVITVVELTKRMTIVAVDHRSWVVPGALCAGMYFLMSYPLARLARRLERRLAS